MPPVKAKAKPTPAVPVSQLSKRRATNVAGVALTAKASPSKVKAAVQTETDYLNSSPVNAARLQESKAQIGLGQSLPIDVQAIANEVARQLSVNALTNGLLSNSVGQASGASAKTSPSVGTTLKSTNPIDSEIILLTSNMDTINDLVSQIGNELEPVLAHESVSEGCEAEPGRSSDSPLHRRLIDRNEQLEFIIARLRYLKSRIRN